MKKHTRVFSTVCSCLLSAVLLLCMPACAAAPAQEPAPEGYSFIELPSSEEQICRRFGGGEIRYVTTDPEEIADLYCDLIIVGKFLGNTDAFAADVGYIYTKGLFEVTDVLKGSYDGQYLEATYSGGIISVEKYLAGMTRDQIASTGLGHIPENERASLYIKSFDPGYGVDPTPGSTYVLLLGHSDSGYVIMGDAFGAMPYQNGKAYDYATDSYKTFSFME